MKTTYYIPKENKGYTMHDGKIKAITLQHITIDDDDEYTTLCVLGNKTEELDYVPTIYPTEDDCAKERNAIEQRAIYPSNASNILNYGDTDGYFYWAEDGKLDRCQDIMIIQCAWAEDGKLKITAFINGKTPRIYRNEALARADHEVEVVEADGSTHLRPSLASRIALNETQKEVFANLLKAIDLCKENNIALLFRTWENDIYAVNKGEGVDWGYEPEGIDVTALVEDTAFVSGSYFSSMGEEDYIACTE